MKVKYLMLFSLALVLTISFAGCATNGKKDVDKPGVAVTEIKVMTATIEAIDYISRTVTLRGPQGNLVTLHVDERARNFNQARVGDKVKAEVLESIAIYVKKHDGSQPAVKEGAAVSVAPRGEKPGIAAADTVVITATVEAIDYDMRMVTLKGPDGKFRTLKVDERAQDMEKVKVGDQVVVRHTVAVAISVNKP